MNSKYIALITTAAMLVSLVGCTSGRGVSSSSASVPESSSSAINVEVDKNAPHIEMQIQEYHAETAEEGSADHCIIEIPKFVANEMTPTLKELNDELDALAEEYQAFAQSEEHQNGMGMEIKSYPFTSERWTQVVITKLTYPAYGTSGDIVSYNYDIQNDKIITVEDAMAQFELTADTLQTGYEENAIKPFEGFAPETTDLEVQGFRLREDDSAVFYLKLSFTFADSEPLSILCSYDTATDQFEEIGANPVAPPTDMDIMDPPLSYARPSVENQSSSAEN